MIVSIFASNAFSLLFISSERDFVSNDFGQAGEGRWLKVMSGHHSRSAHDLCAVHDWKREQLSNDLVVRGTRIMEFEGSGDDAGTLHNPVFGKPVIYHLRHDVRVDVSSDSSISTRPKHVGVELVVGKIVQSGGGAILPVQRGRHLRAGSWSGVQLAMSLICGAIES